ncbi:MAG: isopenicillin N synthase family oxygenase [Chlamydiae bacterium]|nr:isopenicillin N synthase family oxygenase [Chlamydiota bacterium]
MHEVGFFAVRNTGVNRELLQKAYAQAETFFKRDSSYKEKTLRQESSGQRGYVPGEIAKGSTAKDCKQFYHIGRELSEAECKRLKMASNVWPDQPQFKEDLLALYDELEKYSDFLFDAIVSVINRNAVQKNPSDVFSKMTKDGDCLIRALYYPALTLEQTQNSSFYWAAAHTDIDLLTVLPYATEKGLQVEIEGKWYTVIVPEDAFIVNVGDMLENLTNGLFVSAKHRVVALEPGKERFSMVFFVHPTNETSLSPFPACIEQTGGIQQYAPGTRQEFLWERLLELSNISSTLLEAYSKTGHCERQAQFGRESPQVVEMLIKNGLASEELLDILAKKREAAR